MLWLSLWCSMAHDLLSINLQEWQNARSTDAAGLIEVQLLSSAVRVTPRLTLQRSRAHVLLSIDA